MTNKTTKPYWQVNPELLDDTKNVVTFNGRKVRCFPSTYTLNHYFNPPVPHCTGKILGGEHHGKWTTVTGDAALEGCKKN